MLQLKDISPDTHLLFPKPEVRLIFSAGADATHEISTQLQLKNDSN